MLRSVLLVPLFFAAIQFDTLVIIGFGQLDAAVEADVVLKGATLHDGTGQPGKVGDVAIKGDRIVAVGKFAVKGKPRVIDCDRAHRQPRLHRPAHAQRLSAATDRRPTRTSTI